MGLGSFSLGSHALYRLVSHIFYPTWCPGDLDRDLVAILKKLEKCYYYYYVIILVYAVAAAKGVEGIIWSSGRGLMSKLVQPEQQGTLSCV